MLNRLALISLLIPLASRATGQTPRVPTWVVDSSVDKMTDKKIIWAELEAVRPLTYRYGTFRPSIMVICFTGTDTILGDGIEWRFVSQASPSIDDLSSTLKIAYMTLRYDSTESESFEFIIHDYGDGSFMRPSSSFSRRTERGGVTFETDPTRLRDEFVSRTVNARRLLVRYKLITDESVIAEFSLGPRTRPAIESIFGACNQTLPKNDTRVSSTDSSKGVAANSEKVIEPSSDQVFMESVVEERPEVLSGPALNYPDVLRQAGVQGRVLVQAIIDTSGRAEPPSVKVIQSPNPGFDQPAKNYVLRAMFRPGRVHGRAVRVLLNLPLDFKIKH